MNGIGWWLDPDRRNSSLKQDTQMVQNKSDGLEIRNIVRGVVLKVIISSKMIAISITKKG